MDKFNDDFKLLLVTLKRKHPTLRHDYLRLVYLIVVTVGDELWQIVDISSARKTRPAWAGFKTAEEGRTKIM